MPVKSSPPMSTGIGGAGLLSNELETLADRAIVPMRKRLD
jgi:hypothetical protein